MATSGQTLYEVDRDVIIAAAMRKIGALAKGQTPDIEDIANAQVALNGLVAEYGTLGLPLWNRRVYGMATSPGTNEYVLGAGQVLDTPFPLKIEQLIVRDTSGSPIEILPLSRTDFNLLNTTSTGKPLNYTYHPRVNQGTIRFWPIPDLSYTLEVYYYNAPDGYVGSANTPDFPQEWTNALIYGLAVLIAPEYGVPLNDRIALQKEAKDHLDVAKDFAYENTSMFLQPNWDR